MPFLLPTFVIFTPSDLPHLKHHKHPTRIGVCNTTTARMLGAHNPIHSTSHSSSPNTEQHASSLQGQTRRQSTSHALQIWRQHISIPASTSANRKELITLITHTTSTEATEETAIALAPTTGEDRTSRFERSLPQLPPWMDTQDQDI